MGNELRHYTIELYAEGPVFVGDGKKIGKKEYIFLPRAQKVHVPDLEKMCVFFLKHGLMRSYETYLMEDRRDFAVWLRNNGVTEREYLPWIAYTLDSGDAVIEQKGKKEIATFLKDAYGCPYIPGSSLKGALRTILLGTELIQHPERYADTKRSVQMKKLGDKKKYLLQDEVQSLERSVFRTLQRDKDHRSNAVNDRLSGLRVGDSEPLSIEDLTLCQKVDVTTDGRERPLPILRECLKPGTVIRFPLTLSPESSLTPEAIQHAATTFAQYYDDCFLNAFPLNEINGGGNLYLGGGSGYATKTITYPLLGKGTAQVQRVSEIIDATLSFKARSQHKHREDRRKGVSPHMLKCTRYQGELYEMGACAMEIK